LSSGLEILLIERYNIESQLDSFKEENKKPRDREKRERK
jgi:hypothetical protein